MTDNNHGEDHAPRHIEALFIRNIETLRNEEVRLVMRDRLEPNPVDCVNWKAYPYAPKVNFRAKVQMPANLKPILNWSWTS